MKLIGLTGPSGAGKSAVAKILASLGLAILDADEIYHSLILPGMPCTEAIADSFGRSVLNADGSLNRKVLGQTVFSDAEKRKVLNTIAHRFVLLEMKHRLSLLPPSVPAAVFDAPQLFEAGADRYCDFVISVLADRETRISRITARDGISVEAALARISAQNSDAFFRQNSKYILENNDGLDELFPTVRSILTAEGVLLS